MRAIAKTAVATIEVANWKLKQCGAERRHDPKIRVIVAVLRL
jgi:hypothetical protein